MTGYPQVSAAPRHISWASGHSSCGLENSLETRLQAEAEAPVSLEDSAEDQIEVLGLGEKGTEQNACLSPWLPHASVGAVGSTASCWHLELWDQRVAVTLSMNTWVLAMGTVGTVLKATWLGWKPGVEE